MRIPKAMELLTFGIIIIELVIPFFLFIPHNNKIFRASFIIIITALQIGIGLTMQVGYFYIVSIVAMIGIWPYELVAPIRKIALKLPDLWNKSKLPFKASNNNTGFERHGIVVKNGVVLFIIAFCLLWNIGNVTQLPQSIKNVIRPMGIATRLSQNWGMFAPVVFKDDGWFIYKRYAKD